MRTIEAIRNQLARYKLKLPPEKRNLQNVGLLFTIVAHRGIFKLFNETMQELSRVEFLIGEFKPEVHNRTFHILILSNRVFVSEMCTADPDLSTFSTDTYFDNSAEFVIDALLKCGSIDPLFDHGEIVLVEIDESGREEPKYEHNTWGKEEFDYFPAITSLTILD